MVVMDNSCRLGAHIVDASISLVPQSGAAMADAVRAPGSRVTGKVARLVRDYGFIVGDDKPEQDYYFKQSWYRGSPPLAEGEAVTFEVRVLGKNTQAAHILRAGEASSAAGRPLYPTSGYLFDWGYLGYLPNVLSELAGLALKEQWEFKNAPSNPDRPFPILHSYLLSTYERLVLEKKIAINERAGFAAFNTGLVDERYETIYALFSPNNGPKAPWQLAGFCIAGEGADGQDLVRHFNPLPAPAHYFEKPADLLYDPRAGKLELSWDHIIIDNIARFPRPFLEDHRPDGFELKSAAELAALPDPDYFKYFDDLGAAIEADKRTYRRIMNRLKDAVDLSIKRVAWNFKTAIPQYYPRVNRLQLLLPLCLVSDERVDLALAVEKTESGSYLGHTILPLDWAYRNARLICRPDSDWLAPAEIEEESLDAPDEPA